jgi:hypothetical protein
MCVAAVAFLDRVRPAGVHDQRRPPIRGYRPRAQFSDRGAKGQHASAQWLCVALIAGGQPEPAKPPAAVLSPNRVRVGHRGRPAPRPGPEAPRIMGRHPCASTDPPARPGGRPCAGEHRRGPATQPLEMIADSQSATPGRATSRSCPRRLGDAADVTHRETAPHRVPVRGPAPPQGLRGAASRRPGPDRGQFQAQ